MTRRDFVKAVAAAAVPVASSTSAFTVHRRNMWSSDGDDTTTLVQCNRLLESNPDDVLALCHRGQVSPFVRAMALSEADLTKAIRLEPDNPALYYVKGVTLNRVEDLRYSISLLTASGNINGKARCTGIPDIQHWHGSDDGELCYMAHRELGSLLEGQGHIDEALVAFQRAASFRVISQADLERWCESDMQVGRWCEGVIGYRNLIEIEDKVEYRHRLDECERWLRVPRRVLGA